VQEWECLIAYGHTQKDKIIHVNYESKKAFPSKTTFVRTCCPFFRDTRVYHVEVGEAC
jgi:hypothetical protein